MVEELLKGHAPVFWFSGGMDRFLVECGDNDNEVAFLLKIEIGAPRPDSSQRTYSR
jgi:hypothetical protein